jgi:putative transposase
MGRMRRKVAGGVVYHALNRGNGRARIFHKPGDYDAFVRLLRDGQRIVPIRLLGFCLMPNHWHLVLWPFEDGDLSRYIRWVSNTHVKRYREHYQDRGAGHLYQGRFKSFPVQDDYHLLTVLRYVEANPLRAGLARQAAAWRWSSFTARERNEAEGLLSDWPLDRPGDWGTTVEEVLEDTTLAGLRQSIERGRPYGEASWTRRIAGLLGLAGTLLPRGRPAKGPDRSAKIADY